MTELKADFTAALYYNTSEQSGRSTAVKSGYRPHLQFDFDEMQTSGQQIFIGCDTVLPGEIVDAEIKIIAVEHFAGRLYEGMKFKFSEGQVTIGTGIIKRIVNDRLRNLK